MAAEIDAMTLRVLFALFQLAVIAVLLERGLYFIFDWRPLRHLLESRGVKGPVALMAAWFICWRHDFDVIARTIDPGAETQIGIFLTATIVAGGSAAVMTVFNDVLKITREARERIQAEKGYALAAKPLPTVSSKKEEENSQ